MTLDPAKLRFMFISTMNDSPWGGSEELWSRAALRLRADGHDVRASVADWPQKRKYIEPLIRQGVEVEYHLPRQPRLRRRILSRAIDAKGRRYSRLRRFRPDLVVISQGYNAGGFDWARVCHANLIPYIPIVHCNSDHWWFHDLEQAREAYDRARQVFCVSAANLRLLRLQLGEPLPHAEVIRNPWNVSAASCPPWPPESECLHLAIVARLDPAAKGQDLLFQVLARPEWRARPLHLHLYGSGPFEATLRAMVGMLGITNVHFHGHLTDIAEIWARNHLLVLPSRYEGLPLALVEAMWCARPSVVTDVGGNAELCLEGVTGFVAGAPTVPALAAALEQAWQRRGEWQELGRAARRHVEELLPSDPVALFCQRLTQLAISGPAGQSLP